MARDLLLPTPFVASIPTPKTPSAGAIAGFFRGLFRAKPVENEIERFIMENGGVLTDNLEREISRRFGRIV